MNGSFLTQANIKRNEYLLKTEELFLVHKNNWFADFAKLFREVCAQIRKLQDKSALSTVSYLEYTMLYTNFINRRYVADIFVYGEKRYLDKSQGFLGSYDISLMLAYFDKLWDDLNILKKYYVGKVSAHDVAEFMLRTLPGFYSYLTNIARFAIAEGVDQSPLADIDKGAKFMVGVGDYMSKIEPVYEERKNKDADKLAEWFSERLCGTYFFGDYTNLDFSGKSFKYTDFRYAQFRNSLLNKTVLNASSLIGADFRNAAMEGCSLDQCTIYEANFSYAKLKNASFKNTRAKAGLPNATIWKFPGFMPASFRDADLTGADFTAADLTGVDFTGANLADADFTGANLTGVDLTGTVLDGTNFKGSIGSGINYGRQIPKDSRKI